MYKIAVVDDDEHWCLAVKRFFEKSFEVTIFQQVPYSLHELVDYDLVIVDYSIPPAVDDLRTVNGLESLRFLKNNFINPPLLFIATEFIDKDDDSLLKSVCPEADVFFAKNADMEQLLQQIQRLIITKNKTRLERSSQGIYGYKPMYTMAVVDDDKHWCKALERYFRSEFEVYTFPTASEFLKQSFDFDLVLVDYSIPHLDNEDYMESRELIRYLKSLRYPPFVMLVSGYVSKNDSSLGKTICPEADVFFAKDVGLDELSHQIKNLLTCKR